MNSYMRRRVVDCRDHEIHNQWAGGLSLREIAKEKGCALTAITVRVSRHRDRFQLLRGDPCGVEHPASQAVAMP